VLLLIRMEENAYIERLKSLYPAEGEEASNQTLDLADEAVRAWPESPKLWCMRGDLIQLGADGAPYELGDALASYEQAIAIDPKWVEAYEEIGHFYAAIMDDAESAKPFFHQAAVLKNEGSA
jgi:tetratricopeptide (TPR) repeat protein